MEIERRKFQGVLNILSFNRHFYIIGLIVLAMLLIGLVLLETPVLWIWIVAAVFAYGLLMPLLVSAYVYDFSGYYNFEWLKTIGIIDSKPQHLVNINAGFDETSFILQEKFPESEIRVFDFYNPKRHTEAAIVRARKVSWVYPNTQQIDASTIPLPDHSVDVLFLLSTAHEIRANEEKVEFLKECHRVCKPEGKVITVEHLRDAPNFLAFSVGFTHFFSRRTWRKVFQEAGFTSFDETKFTPFMSVFKCSP